MSIKNFKYEQERDLFAPFILTTAKLSRLVDVAQSRLNKIHGEYVFEIKSTTKSGKFSVFDSAESVMEQDNSVKNPIRKIEINGGVRGESMFFITFGPGDQIYKERGCHLYVAGDNSTWVNETFAELEEQGERVITNDFYSKLGNMASNRIIAPVLSLILVFLALSVLLNATVSSIGKLGHIPTEQIETLNSTFNSAKTNEEKIDAIFLERRFYVNQLSGYSKERKSFYGQLISKKYLFIILPILCAVGCVIYVALRCSPTMVFKWGDWEEHFERLVKTRSVIMISGVLSLVVGIASSLIVSSLIG